MRRFKPMWANSSRTPVARAWNQTVRSRRIMRRWEAHDPAKLALVWAEVHLKVGQH